MVMLFMNEIVRKFLLAQGYVYTFRVKRHKLGRDWATEKRTGKKLCDITIQEERPILDGDELQQFAHGSGFETGEEWAKAIHERNPKLKDIQGYVYLVTVRESKKTTDYIFCETCDMFVDFWKYDHDIEAAGHEGHTWRYVTQEELDKLVKACRKHGCFEEE
jgi:hypothetical protein